MRLKRPGLWLRRPHKGASPDAGTVEAQEQQRLDLGLMLRRRREELGLSLRDLANETRITTTVIEALERGWRDRLPERAYLASMLPQIERRLALPGGCLDPLLPPPVLLRLGRAKAGLGLPGCGMGRSALAARLHVVEAHCQFRRVVRQLNEGGVFSTT